MSVFITGLVVVFGMLLDFASWCAFADKHTRTGTRLVGARQEADARRLAFTPHPLHPHLASFWDCFEKWLTPLPSLSSKSSSRAESMDWARRLGSRNGGLLFRSRWRDGGVCGMGRHSGGIRRFPAGERRLRSG
ncbi:hypothetical protein C8R46DRAFT_29219 [Mycena filopes]|nr:hypothetical protein C8R46DRAFT_29219 [Mycena filopes]